MPARTPILDDTMTFDAAGGAATQFAVLTFSATGDNYCRMPAAAAALPVGVANEALGTTVGTATSPPSSTGHPIGVQVAGIAICVASAAISIGDRLGISGTNGRVRTGVSGDYVVGVARSAAANAGDQIRVHLAIGSGSRIP